MSIKTKFIFSIIITLSAFLYYRIMIDTAPVAIIAIHNNNGFSSVLVRNFPYSDKKRIKWWLDHKQYLKENYGIPQSDTQGSFTVIFWDFGDGYKETDGYDSLCFRDVVLPKNCIDKNALLSVKNGKNSGLEFWVDSGIYRITQDGYYKMRKYQ
ncbi:DUF943 family protein [Rosenbergiella australiborealis]|uniref:DUF943 family protein n=1 Tax=Rosenbergiella australiborealis TaxID=1544696 RepID=UPI0030B8CF73